MTATPATYLVHLTEMQCDALLYASDVGRLGVIVDGRPAIFPVAHAYVDGAIVFPTTPGTKLDAALSWPHVAFEVDTVDEASGVGWSVMVAGRAEEVELSEDRRRYAKARRVPWRTGPSLRWIRIVPESITGREIFAEQYHP